MALGSFGGGGGGWLSSYAAGLQEGLSGFPEGKLSLQVPSVSIMNGCGSCTRNTSRPHGRGWGGGAVTSASVMRNVWNNVCSQAQCKTTPVIVRVRDRERERGRERERWEQPGWVIPPLCGLNVKAATGSWGSCAHCVCIKGLMC